MSKSYPRSYRYLRNSATALRASIYRNFPNVAPIFVNRPPTHEDSFISCQSALFLTVNFTVGTGILNFPKSFAESGNVIGSLILSCVLMIFITGSIIILSFCVDISGADTYEGVIRFFCGPLYSDICSCTIVLYLFGSCTTSLVIIGDQSDRLLASFYGSHFCQFWYLNRHFVVPLVTLICIAPLCFIKNIDFLKYPSFTGVVVSGYIVFLIIWKYYQSSASFTLLRINWTRSTLVIPIVCYGFQTHLSWIPTYSRMNEKTDSPKLIALVVISMLIASLSYTLVIIYGVLTFPADALDANILKNYDAADNVVLTGVVCVIFKVITTYPGVFFCARVTIDKWYSKLTKGSLSFTSRLASTVIIWILINTVIATLFPDIGSINDLLGSLSITFIFIHPGMCLLKALPVINYSEYKFNLRRLLKIISIFYITLGVLILFLSLVQWIDVYLIHTRPRPLSLCDMEG